MSDHSELKRLAEALEGVTRVSSVSDCDKFNSFYRAVSPAAVLALIAEVEGLRAQHGRDSAELRSLCQARDDARKERDQLKVEADSRRKLHSRECVAMAEVQGELIDERDQLKAEVEALRKDAERYRWLRDRCTAKCGFTLTIAQVGMWDLTGWSGDDPDREIDAAMGKGEKA